jgi:hypothetical protein
MCYNSEIKRVENDETVANPSTATFQVIFKGLESLQLPQSKSIPRGSAVRSENILHVYEITKHGDMTYSVIGSKISPIDSLPLRFVVTKTSEGCKIVRIVSAFDSVNLEYAVGRRPNDGMPSFLNAFPAELHRQSSNTSQDYEHEAIDAYKVGILINELEKLGTDWSCNGGM